MPLEVHPLQPEDLEAWVRLHYLAFKTTTVACLWRSEPSAASYSILAKSRGRELLEHSPRAHFFKVVDTELDNKPVAVAKWRIYNKERSEEEVKSEFTLPAQTPEECRAAREKFMAGIFKARWDIMGTRPYVLLDILSTHPDHHRRGAGTMLVKWGTDKADELGLESYLEGSSQGRPLYERNGYQPVREVKSDFSEFGGGLDVHMVSGALSNINSSLLTSALVGNDKATSKDVLDCRDLGYRLLFSFTVLQTFLVLNSYCTRETCSSQKCAHRHASILVPSVIGSTIYIDSILFQH